MIATVDSLLREATAQLVESGVASARVDAELLLGATLDLSRGEILRLALLGCGVSDQDATAYRDVVHQRTERVPLQHLTGYADFAGLRLSVGPGVFVPRPETEVLVARGYEVGHDLTRPVIVDLCTGSGAIAAALKRRWSASSVHAVEVSAHAHAWAEQNFARLDLDVDLRLGDARTTFDELDGAVDLVTCNPPYIPTGAVPQDPEVRLHDPSIALYGDSEDGLAIPVQMAARAAVLLRKGGVLLMEHAETQGEALASLLVASGDWARVVDHRDWAGRSRFVEAARA
ncbi:MAG: peptide chain release factor N(5)-glutamine methyltransferase [Ornithinimicrobium sp.]